MALKDLFKPNPEKLIQRAQRAGRANPEEGLQILDPLLSKEPTPSGAHNLYGQLSMRIGDLATARDAFERGIAGSPDEDHHFDWAYLGLIVGLQGEEENARKCAAKAGTIRLQADFANDVRSAYIAWSEQRGRTPSRLG